MKRALYRIGLFLIFACILPGCRTGKSQNDTLATQAAGSRPDRVEPPIMILIPKDSFPKQRTDHFARILTPLAGHSATNIITVNVSGSVRSPGPVKLRAGSTVLEAILWAGGFTENCNRIVIDRFEGRQHHRIVLTLHLQPALDKRNWDVWCGTNAMNPDGETETEIGDYAVKNGDMILAGKWKRIW